MSEVGGGRSQSVAEQGGEQLEGSKEDIWSRSCLGSQRCTRSRPAQRTCRLLAVGTAPGAGPLGTENILLMAAMVASASLFLTVTLPTSVSYLIVIWKFGSSVEAGKGGIQSAAERRAAARGGSRTCGAGMEAAARGIRDPRRTLADSQLAARAGTVNAPRGGDGGALLLAAVKPPTSSLKAPVAGSLGTEGALAFGAMDDGASLLGAVESPTSSTTGVAALVSYSSVA